MSEPAPHPLHELPPAQSGRLMDFETAEVISQMIYPPRPVLIVSGHKPYQSMTVELVPLTYIRQPPFWGIEVVGKASLPAGPTPMPAIAIPYTVELNLAGVTGSVGVEVIGATKTERLHVPTVEDASPYVGAVEHGRFRRMYPPWIDERYLRLTTMGVKDDAGPAAGEIDLSPYNGSILRVLGHYEDGWIYSATVVEQVPDSILGILARQVFGDSPE
jgi:hypothetical protein